MKWVYLYFTRINQLVYTQKPQISTFKSIVTFSFKETLGAKTSRPKIMGFQISLSCKEVTDYHGFES